MGTKQETEEIAPYVGCPATIHLSSDSQPAVVVKVNAKSIVVAVVAVDESAKRRINSEGEPYPCWAWDGITDQITGLPERYAIVHTSYGTRYRNGSISVTLGKSVRVRDYRV